MANLKYSFANGVLRLGRGKETLSLDAANSLFHPLVRCLDTLRPAQIHVFCDLTGKLYLNTVRALWHCALEDFQITLLRRDVDAPWEDFLYPLSKTFGTALRARSKRGLGKASAVRFSVRREIPLYEHSVSLNVVSDGKDLARLAATLENLHGQDRSGVLVRVVGPSALGSSPLQRQFPYVDWVADDGIYSQDRRFPISRKKNLVLRSTAAERIVLLHERIRLEKGWVARLKEVAAFDLYTCALTTSDGRRYLDKFGIRYAGFPSLKKHHYFLTWGEDNANQLVDGGLFVIHQRALGDFRFDNALHWGEMEDVDLVLRMKLAGCLVSFDAANRATSVTGGHFSLASKYPLSALYKIWVRRLFIGYWLTRWAAIWRAR